MASLIGSKPNQVSTNGDLGTMAFREQEQFLAVAGAQTVTGAKTFSEIITASKGVAFPATQVASADANTLDDYEEGTWTATFTGWTTAPTVYYTTYTKIGRAVTINMYANGGVVVYSNIGGLPFTSSNMGASVIAVRVSGYDVAFYGTVGAAVTTIASVNQINTLTAQNWTLSFTYTTN